MDQQPRAFGDRHLGQQREEDPPLLRREVGVGIGLREMRVEPAPVEVRGRADKADQATGLRMPDAGAAHARVDLDMHAHLALRRGGAAFQRLGLGDGIQGHLEVQRDRARHLRGQGRAQQQDVGVVPDLAEPGGFADVGDGEAIDAGLQEAGRDLRHAMTVGVGLDDRDVADVRGQGLLDATDVAIDGRQVDLDPGARDMGAGRAHAGPR